MKIDFVFFGLSARGILEPVISGILLAIAFTLVKYLSKYLHKLMNKVLGISSAYVGSKTRLALALLLLSIDVGVLFKYWDWHETATIGDIASVSSLVMAYWFLVFKITFLFDDVINPSHKEKDAGNKRA